MTSPFLDFSNPLKQIKIKSLNPKTLLKLAVRTLVEVRIFAFQILVENSSNVGYL